MGIAKVLGQATNAGLMAVTGYQYARSQDAQTEIKVIMPEMENRKVEKDERAILVDNEIICIIVLVIVGIGMYFLGKYCRKQKRIEQIRLQDA